MAAQQATAVQNAAARPRNLRQKESDKKKAARMFHTGGFFAVGWWSWGDLNPRPQAFFEQFYMCSRLI